MTWENYDDVLQQLTSYGLVVTSVEPGRLSRVPTTEDRGKSKTGWYSLHEMRTGAGGSLLVGAYGSWRDGGSQRISLKGRKLSDDERAAIKARIAEDRKRAQAKRRAEAERCARRAESAWRRLSETGSSPYLTRKGVGAYGVRFSDQGNLVIPITDTNGRIHGLQVIYSDDQTKARKGRDKDFWPAGLAKRGHFHLIGSPVSILVIAEGYATAASIHAATGWPVAVAFDAGSLLPVAEALRKRYRSVHILIAADDDFATPANPGVSAASAAALAVGGGWVAPEFGPDPVRVDVQAVFDGAGDLPLPELRQRLKETVGRRAKLTDYNDLHAAEGLNEVRAQLEARVRELGWDLGGRGPARAATTQGEGGDGDLSPITSLDELHDRYALVYGHGSTVFDYRERMLLTVSDMRDACIRRELHRDWMESPRKKIVRIREVGFDPACSDPEIRCNLWGGWPTTPRAGRCDVLIDLLQHLCSHEENRSELFTWVLRWLAFPIQHPGAKMKTALVLHGPQGVGKNLFFEAVMAIYGQYGRVVDQSAVEDKFNDWASKKLFLIADEVVARQELYHTKNKIKGLITGDWIRINPKNVTPYDERNHVNIVFMSNEIQPLILEPDDRRFAVMWTPAKLPGEFYVDVKREIDGGGIAALHDYLLNLDLGDFQAHTLPPMTQAKRDLIEMSMDSTDRFIAAWCDGELDPVPVVPCRSKDFYALYRAFCTDVGIPKYAPSHILLARAGKHPRVHKDRARYMTPGKLEQKTFIFPRSALNPPEGVDQQVWLADCVEKFTAGFRTWRGGGHD